jgi:hypothetical protein
MSGGLGVPSSNLGAPTNHIRYLTPKTPQRRARRGRCTLVAQSGESITVRRMPAESRRRSRRHTFERAITSATVLPGDECGRARSAVGAAHRAGGPTRCPPPPGARVGCVDHLMGSPFGSETRTSRPPVAAGSAFGCELAKDSKLEDDSLLDWRAILPSVANVSTGPIAGS